MTRLHAFKTSRYRVHVFHPVAIVHIRICAEHWSSLEKGCERRNPELSADVAAWLASRTRV